MTRRVTPAAFLCAVLLAGCGADDPLAGSAGLVAEDLSPIATTTSPVASATPVGTAAAEPTASAAIPTPIEVEQGDKVWGVYLALVEGESSTDEIAGAEAAATRNNWLYSSGDLGCDQGAAENLGLTEGAYFRVAVYFASADDARTFADAYLPGAIGIAEATLFCLD